MKKLLFAATALFAVLFASCDKNDETINSVIPEAADGARIAITLIGAGDTETRAFFDTPGLHPGGTRVQIGDLLAAQIRGRHRVLVLRRSELRCFVGQDPGGPYGPRGKLRRSL